MDASQLPKGKSAEGNSDGRPLYEPGIYQHKETKGIFITAEGEAGVLQADALMSPVWKDAWEKVGEVPNRLELLAMRKKQQIQDAKDEAEQKKAEEAELAEAMAEAKPTAAKPQPEAVPAPGTGQNY